LNGDTPQGWHKKPLSEIAAISGGSTPSTGESKYWNGDIPFVTPTDITSLNGSNFLEKTARTLTSMGLNSTSSRILPPGTVLMTSRATIGDVAINRMKVVTNQGFANFIPIGGIDSLWLLYLLKSKKSEFKRLASGSTFLEVSRSSVRGMRVDVPPLVEQRGIAEVLGTVDEAIRRTDAVIEKAEELKRGLMQRLLTRGIGHTEFKQTELGEIPKTWEIKKIDEICNVVRGASPRPIGDPTYFSEKGRGWIRISDVTSTYKYLQETTQYLSEKGVSKSRKVDPGDLIMSICATIGKPIILDMKACIHDGFVLFDGLSNEVDKEFLFYLLQSKETDFIGKKQVGTQGNLNTTIVGKTKIILPPMEEQKKITEICRKCDDKIFMEKKNKEKMNNVKNGLMQALLSGKVRVELREDGLHRIGDG
jgi:type I restriction enzyme S subunit